MSANPVARPQSRRGILTAALAGTAAGAATFGGHVVLAAAVDPDPIFAAIAKEREAARLFTEASNVHSIADAAFVRSGFNRKPRVQIGEYVAVQRRASAGTYEPVPEGEQVPQPVYLYDHDAIDLDCNLHRDVTHSPKAEERRQRLHAELDADAILIVEARAELDDAERAYDRAHEAWRAEASILVAVAPTTTAGLLALIDRFEAYTEGCMIDTDEDGLTSLLVHVRCFLTEARA